MRKVEIELMTVTPLFLGGSDPRGQPPELRPPSFRGAMRYWYRAALGGVVGDDWKKVRQLEGKVFGITSDKQENEGQGSAVNVRISQKKLPIPRDYIKERRQPPSGKDYLFWSLAESGSRERGNYQPARKFIEEGFSFSVILSTQKLGSQGDFYLRQAIYSLWLAIHLGGIGSRSRRMAGSLSPIRPFEVEGLTFGVKGSDVSAVADEISKNLHHIRQSMMMDFGQLSHLSDKPSFDILDPASSHIWVLGKFRTATDALNIIGSKMRDFRNRREPDHRLVARWLNGSKIPTVERVQFGLPIVYRYTNGPFGTIIAGVKQDNKDEKIERRASPLWLSTLRCPDGQIVVTAVLFNNQFLPRGAYLTVSGRGHVEKINPPGSIQLVESWLEEQFPNRMEVKYA